MKHEKMRIVKILDEILNFSFKNGATEMHIDIKSNGNETKIYFKDNSSGISEERIKKIKQLLSAPKQREVEEYYWELLGESDYCDEFTLIGIMTDKAQIHYTPEKGLELTLYRKISESKK